MTTRDKNTKSTRRGMTETFANMTAARTHLASLADQAQTLGWERKLFAASRRPDAFSTLPAPKAAAHAEMK